MITLQMEFKKIRRKKIGLTMCALIGIQFTWLLWATNNPSEAELLQGWLGHLQSQPLLCAIMMPTIMSVLASRLADIEHKGNTYKQLKTLRPAGTLYLAKVLCGFLFIVTMTAARSDDPDDSRTVRLHAGCHMDVPENILFPSLGRLPLLCTGEDGLEPGYKSDHILLSGVFPSRTFCPDNDFYLDRRFLYRRQNFIHPERIIKRTLD